ncbi:MAG: uL15m family ribosomal protein, partial [Pseudomonadota bacterium]
DAKSKFNLDVAGASKGAIEAIEKAGGSVKVAAKETADA